MVQKARFPTIGLLAKQFLAIWGFSKLRESSIFVSILTSSQLEIERIVSLPKQFLYILGSQIKTERIFHLVSILTYSQIKIERIFSLASILTGLWECKLGLTKLDNIVTIYKNYSSDSRSNCSPFLEKDVTDFPLRKLLEESDDAVEDADFFEENWASSSFYKHKFARFWLVIFENFLIHSLSQRSCFICLLQFLNHILPFVVTYNSNYTSQNSTMFL